MAPERGPGTRFDHSVQRYMNFKFIITMEHTSNNGVGYITEKVIDGLLAGSVPIYGGSQHITDVINPQRLMLVNVTNIRDTIHRIVTLMVEPSMYDLLLHNLSQVDAVSGDQMRRFFSWHPAVWSKYGDDLRRRIVSALLRACN